MLELGNISSQGGYSRWLRFLITEGMDSACYYATVPFLFHLTEHMTDDHHTSTAITNYGLLLGITTLGRIIAKDLPPVQDAGAIFVFAGIMIIALLLIILSNNYAVVIVVFFFKEMIGGLMSRMHQTLSSVGNRFKETGMLYNDSSTSFSVFTTDNNIMRRNLTICMFSVLISSSLYSQSDEVRFPSFFPILFIALVWGGSIVLYSFQLSSNFTFRSSSVADKAGSSGIKGNERKVLREKNSQELEKYIQSAPPVPQNFIDVCRGNVDRAKVMYTKCLEWRYEHDVDHLLSTPQNHFHDILRLWPHGIHGRSKDGCVVLYEILGRARVRDLVEAGITLHDLIWHFNLRNEYVFQKVLVESTSVPLDERKPIWGNIMTVVDVKGISFRDLSTDVISFIKQNSDIIDNFYPLRVKRLIICNVPSWFSSVWGVVTAVLPQAVKDKIRIIHGVDGLEEIIEASQRPVEYGGTLGTLGSSREHLEFLSLSDSWKDHALEIPVSNKPNTDQHQASHKNQGRWPSISSLWQPRKSPTRAYLGQKNGYRYDPELRSWTLEGEESDGSDSDIDTHSEGVLDAPEDNSHLEEHGLVLAIQAAHLASAQGSIIRSSSMSSVLSNPQPIVNISGLSENSNSSANNEPTMSGSSTVMDASPWISSSQEGPGIIGSGNMTQINGGGGKLSPDIFLIALGVYILSAFMHVAALTLLPVWMMLSPTVGGLGYSVADIGLVTSGAAFLLLLVDTYIRDRLEFVLKSSPLRMVRITGAIMAVTSVLLPLLLGAYVQGDSSTSNANEMLSHESPDTGIIHQRPNDLISASILTRSPTNSLLYLPNSCILVASFVCAAYVGRKASTMLLQVAISPVFYKPEGVVRVLGSAVDILAPPLCCLVYRTVYDHTLHHHEFHGHLMPSPLNVTSFFSICLAISTLLYCSTFLLTLQFRGDFGVMPDHIDTEAQSAPARAPTLQTTTSSSDLSSGTGVSELKEIVTEDMRLLLSPPKYGYGSKLYNLKVDLKDL